MNGIPQMRSRIYHLYVRSKDEDVETDTGGLSPDNWETKYKNMIEPFSPNVEFAKPTPWQRKPNWK